MGIHELYWIPSTAVDGYGWTWLYRNWTTLTPIRLRLRIGIAALALATLASLCLLVAVVHSWVTGVFTSSTPYDNWGVCSALGAILLGIVPKARLRLLSFVSGLFSLAAWLGFVYGRRAGLL